MTAEQDRLDIETVAREMFPAEYAAITDDQPMDPAKVRAVKAELARRQADHDVSSQVEAVLDVIAPKISPDIAQALGITSALRNPLIRVEYDGKMIMPNDDQLRALAEEIVTAIRTAGGPS